MLTGNSILIKLPKHHSKQKQQQTKQKVTAVAVQQWNTRHRLDNSRLHDLQSGKFFYPQTYNLNMMG